MTSPTARSLAYARKMGMTAGIVEQTIPHTFIKRDFLSFADLIICDIDNKQIIAVQVTSGSNHAARVAKIRAEPKAAVWRFCGGKIQTWSWSKTGPRGKPKRWTLRIEEVP